MHIIEYDPKYKQAFIDFNTAWIVEGWGALEEADLEIFDHIEDLLEKGAMIFFAVRDEVPLATIMVMPLEDGTWELCKLASNKDVPHPGAGTAAFRAASDWAVAHGAKRLFLLSNSHLKPALSIYHKLGFTEIPLDDYEFSRGDIAFEKIIGEGENIVK